MKDSSLLTPPFKIYFLNPVGKLVPLWIPANIITLLANGCMFFAMYISFSFEELKPQHYLLISFLVFCYLLGDLLDGFQAKRSKTSSPLGEFFDHFLDTFVNIFMLMTLYSTFKITSTFFISLTIMVSYLAQAAVFSEQQRTGWLIFEKIGVFEAFSVTIMTFLFCAFTPLQPWLISKVISNISYVELILGSMSVIAIFTFISSIFRSSGISFWFVMFVLQMIAIVIISLLLPDQTFHLPWMIAFNSIDYISRIIHSHLAGTKEPKPDILLPFLLFLVLMMPELQKPINYFILAGYPLIKSLFNAIRTIHLFKKHWIWVNPKNENIQL